MSRIVWSRTPRLAVCVCLVLLITLCSDFSPVRTPQRVAAASPPYIQAAEVLGSDTAQGDTLGQSTAVSADATMAIVGSQHNHSERGAAYVYARNAGAWSQPTKLTASISAFYDYFGYAVAINGDGTTAAIGAPGKNSSAGSVYVFTRSGSIWTQRTELIASDSAAASDFGAAVAISADGGTILVGAPQTGHAGAAYIFAGSGSIWSQQAKFALTDADLDDDFGNNLAISADGNTVAIGAWQRNIGANTNAGEAFVAVRTTGTWGSLVDIIAPDQSAYAYFSHGMAISGDGSTLAIGASEKSSNLGYVYIYTGGGTSWTFQSEFTTNQELYPSIRFGSQVALSTDGSLLTVAAPNDVAISGYYTFAQGVLYTYTRSGSAWVAQQRIIVNDVAQWNDLMGSAMSMSGDGSVIVSGAPAKGMNVGAAYIFTTGTLSATLNTSPVTAGIPPSITISARDAGNNVITGFTDGVNFSTNDPQGTVTGGYQFTAADAGVKTLTPVTFKTAGSWLLTMRDSVSALVTGSLAVTVAPGSTAALVFAGVQTAIQAGTVIPFSLTAKDSYGNTTPAYTGTVHFTSADFLAALPSDTAFSAVDAGVKAFSLTFNTAGIRDINVGDTIHGLSAAVSGIAVSPTIASVNPAIGNTAGGSVVVIMGRGFADGATARFGGVAATTLAITNTSLTVTTPPHVAGQVAVDVTVNGQQAIRTNGFRYDAVQALPGARGGSTGGSGTPPNPAPPSR